MLMIQAGPPVDDLLAQLAPLLEPGDIVIDGGNSLYTDTARRTALMEEQGISFVGAGISGGEDGARHGPSIMPGGSEEAWPHIRELFQSIAAKVEDGTPCCDWIGPGGSGHYVKMVHNGIEYGDMQVIAEAYLLMRDGLAMSPAEMSEAFRNWGNGRLDSFLIDITADILAFETPEGTPLLDEILDAAGQKGTGRWAVASALEQSIPTTLIAEAVFARMVSALNAERAAAAAILAGPETATVADRGPMLDALEDALYASKIVSYAQGFMQLRAASDHYGWDLDLGRIASLWREGCIIRAVFLDDITAAFDRDPKLPNLLLDPFFREALRNRPGWMAASARVRCHRRHRGPGLRHRPRLLRRVSGGTRRRQPDPSAARLLRRPHLRANRQPPRRVLPHQLDRTRRRDHRRQLPGLTLNPGNPGFERLHSNISGPQKGIEMEQFRRRNPKRGRWSQSLQLAGLARPSR